MKKYFEIPYCLNTQYSFKLKEILKWCNEKKNYHMSKQLLNYITDNNLINLEKEYYIHYIRYLDFIKNNKGNENEYEGYSLIEKENI